LRASRQSRGKLQGGENVTPPCHFGQEWVLASCLELEVPMEGDVAFVAPRVVHVNELRKFIQKWKGLADEARNLSIRSHLQILWTKFRSLTKETRSLLGRRTFTKEDFAKAFGDLPLPREDQGGSAFDGILALEQSAEERVTFLERLIDNSKAIPDSRVVSTKGFGS